MRPVTVVLVVLLIAVQYPLWWGHGGWLRVHELQQQLTDQERKNTSLQERNDRLAGEVEDLKSGSAALEERARYELGMVKADEVFVQFVSPEEALPRVPSGQSTSSTRGQISAQPMRVVPEPPAHGRAAQARIDAAKARREARGKEGAQEGASKGASTRPSRQ